MKRILLIGSMVVIVVLLLCIFAKSKVCLSAAGSFDGVMPFTTVGGLMGFFDQKDGKVYLYDGNLEKCLLITQVEELGKSMKVIEKGF